MASVRRNTRTQLTFLPEEAARRFDFAAERKELLRRACVRDGEDRLGFARAAAASVMEQYWVRACAASGGPMPIRLSPIPSIDVSAEPFGIYADACARLDWAEAFYHIGELYTGLLPDEYRTRHGIYYTPPQLVGHMLDVLEKQGVDWSSARVLDPACGGAAFAAYVAQRMLAANTFLSPEDRLRDLSERLVGFDVDPFASWLSAVLLDVVCLPVLRAANRRIDGVIRHGDTLLQQESDLGRFDVVIGNPPYGKLTLTPVQRQRFSRSLYGHANIYGVFTDLAVSFTKPNGLIGFVTPTSFLGGEYFKNLRDLLLAEAAPTYVGFVSDRTGVFSNVLQETLLAVFRRSPAVSSKRRLKATHLSVESICPGSQRTLAVDSLGSFSVAPNKSPWILPRARPQISLVRQLIRMRARLADYGYRVATGQLVWNRHKTQFCDRAAAGRYPVLWAECIQPDGSFEFRAENRSHRPFIHVGPDQDHLINQEPCVLVQRTTSKEQTRRLIAAVIPNSFVLEHPGYVVENHVNMLMPTTSRPAVPLAILSRLLNTFTVDHAFRCISGSVAVSAYELESLPMPDADKLMQRVRSVRPVSGSSHFEEVVQSLYRDT